MSNDEDQDSHSEVPPNDPALTVAAEPTDDADEEFGPFDEIHEQFAQEQVMMTERADGMPAPPPGQNAANIPALSKETLVCMADRSKYVTRDPQGYVVGEWSPKDVTRVPNGQWRAHWKDAVLHVTEGNRPLGVTAVEPIRPQCQHYARQCVDFEENAEHKVYFRLCSARRTTEGTFMSVRNCGVYACELRNPRDVATEAMLDDFDVLKEKQGRERTETNIFNINAPTDAEK